VSGPAASAVTSATAIPACSLLVRTRILTGTLTPVVLGGKQPLVPPPPASSTGCLFPISYWLIDSAALLHSRPIYMPFFLQCQSLHSEDGGSKVLRNVGILLQHTTWHNNPEDLDLNMSMRNSNILAQQ
jgi:hypothetical protein